MIVVELSDGYNGHKAMFNPEPLERDGQLVKLGAIGIGKGWLFRWAHESELSEAPHYNVEYDAARDAWVRS